MVSLSLRDSDASVFGYSQMMMEQLGYCHDKVMLFNRIAPMNNQNVTDFSHSTTQCESKNTWVDARSFSWATTSIGGPPSPKV